MLSTDTLKFVEPLAEHLEHCRVAVTPVPNTPLAALCTDSNFNPENYLDEASGEYAFAPNLVEQDTRGADNGHGAELAATAGFVAQSVANHINFARNVVAPAVSELVEAAVSRMGTYAQSQVNTYEVNVATAPLVYSSPQLLDILKDYAGIPYSAQPFDTGAPAQTNEELLALLATGNRALDADVRTQLAVDPGALQWVWDSIFRGVGKHGEISHLETYFTNPKYGRLNTLLTFLLAGNLVENPLEGSTGTLGDYRTRMAYIRDQAGRMLACQIDQQGSHLKQGRLVVDYTGNIATVDESVYNQFLQRGGTNEMIMGEMVLGSRRCFMQDVLDSATDNTRAWNRHVGLLTASEASSRFANTIRGLQEGFCDQMNRLTEGDAVKSGGLSKIQERFDDELSKVSEGDFRDIHATALRLLCRSRFANTDAECFLTDMVEIKSQSPQLDSREVAAVAAAKYVACWVASQIKVNKTHR